MDTSNPPSSGTSKVYLVGAGPGDPGLLTVRASELISTADAVVYDYLVDESILGLVRRDALLVDVGKRPSRPMPQSKVTEELISTARRYAKVVRLKGGDPFVFGRGGEEALALAEAGIPFEVVPGVTSAIAVPAYAGIPITHRGVASSFTVLTGHSQDASPLGYDWDALVRIGGTLVFLMGVGHRKGIAAGLIEAGMDPRASVSAVVWGTRPDQRVVTTTLENLGESEVESPAVIVIGAVNDLGIDWFRPGPLAGLRVVVTRAEGDAASTLEQRLNSMGASVVRAPSIEISDPADGGAALRLALAEVENFDWIVFTSQNAVGPTFDLIGDLRRLGKVRLAAVGRATAEAIRARGVGVDMLPERAVGESLVEAFPNGPGSVLLPQADIARSVVTEGLSHKGWSVRPVVAYSTVKSSTTVDPELFEKAQLITFTSGSTVEAFVDKYGLQRVPGDVGSIGPITTAAARSKGVTVSFEANRHDIDGLCEAILAWWVQRGSPT